MTTATLTFLLLKPTWHVSISESLYLLFSLPIRLFVEIDTWLAPSPFSNLCSRTNSVRLTLTTLFQTAVYYSSTPPLKHALFFHNITPSIILYTYFAYLVSHSSRKYVPWRRRVLSLVYCYITSIYKRDSKILDTQERLVNFESNSTWTAFKAILRHMLHPEFIYNHHCYFAANCTDAGDCYYWSTLYTYVCCVLSCFSYVQLFTTLWAEALQAPLSMRFLKQVYWNGLACPPLGHLPDPGIKTVSLMSPALAGRFFITSTTWEAPSTCISASYCCRHLGQTWPMPSFMDLLSVQMPPVIYVTSILQTTT